MNKAIFAFIGVQVINAISLKSNEEQDVIEAAYAAAPKIIACPCIPPTCPVDLDCDCPHLQDAGIAVNCGDNYGVLNFHDAQATVLGTSREEYFPDVRVDGATATNTCSLEVGANKICGTEHVTRTFTIGGNITVDECVKTDGCEGNRLCSDGRHTATKQHLTKLDDTDFDPNFKGLCKEAAENAGEAGSCCP